MRCGTATKGFISFMVALSLFTVWNILTVNAGDTAAAQDQTLAEKVDLLIDGLSNVDFSLRRKAAIHLVEIARENPENMEIVKAVPALLKALDDENEEVRLHAAGALGAIGDESVIPNLEKLTQLKPVHDGELMVDFPRAAAEAIEEIQIRQDLTKQLSGLNAHERASVLVNYLKSLNEKRTWPNFGFVRQRILDIGTPAVPMLIDLLQYTPNENPWGQWYVIQARVISILGDIGGKQAIPILKEALESKYTLVKSAAKVAIEKLEAE